MYVRFIKIIILFTLAVGCILSLAACAQANDEKCVYDFADLLDDADEQRINEAANSAGESSFFVLTHDSTNTRDSLWGEDFLREYGHSQSENIVILVITLDNSTYYYNLYTYGTANRRISDREVDKILDAPSVYSNIKSGKLAEGTISFIELSNEAMALPWAIIIIVAILIGAVVGGIVCGIAVAKYKMKMRPTNYPLEKYAKMELTDKKDVFINSRVSVQIVSNGGNGGRGGGFGGRSGGGGFGGGAGHRGGR